MAKRKAVVKHDSSDVQGEGSYVVLSDVKVKEIRELRQKATDESDYFDAGLEMVSGHIIDWNWVDDYDELLPLPKDDPEVVDHLTSDEALFLVNCMMGTDKAKN